MSRAAILASALHAGCGDDAERDEIAEFEELDTSICDPSSGPFSSDPFLNEHFPLPVGQTAIFAGEEAGVELRVESTVLAETELIDGLETRAVEVRQWRGGDLAEVTREYYAQAFEGTICALGGDVAFIEDGEVTRVETRWRAGEGGAEAGVILPGTIRDGVVFPQQRAPGVAEDMSAIVDDDLDATVPVGNFDRVLLVIVWDPLAGETSADGEDRLYAPEAGVIVDGPLELVEITRP